MASLGSAGYEFSTTVESRGAFGSDEDESSTRQASKMRVSKTSSLSSMVYASDSVREKSCDMLAGADASSSGAAGQGKVLLGKDKEVTPQLETEMASKVLKLEGNEQFLEASLKAVAALQEQIETDLSAK